MPCPIQRFPLISLALALGVAGVAAGLSACAGKSSGSATTLHAADFRASATDPSPAPTGPPVARPSRELKVEEIAQPPLPSDVSVLRGAPPIPPATGDSAAPAMLSPTPVTVDALIGDINGSPIYASTFFEPVDARLTELATKYANNPQRWNTEASEVIATRLRGLMLDQVLLAEARAALTPEQKLGLLGFIDQVRRDLVSHGGGGAAAVDESLKDQGEQGLEATLKKQIDRQLILQTIIREKVLPRATVSWHDVQVEYERRAELFNPDSKAVLRMIWVPAASTALVEQIKSELKAGTAFDEIAARPENEFLHDKGGILERTFRGEYDKAALVAPAALNTAALSLKPGTFAGPISDGNTMKWIHLDRIETPQSKSIYDVQLAIYSELRERKYLEERAKYIESLFQKQSTTKFVEMAEKLMDIAAERYLGVTR